MNYLNLRNLDGPLINIDGKIINFKIYSADNIFLL